MKHFELTKEYITLESGIKLYGIKATRDSLYAKIGDLGGFVESEENLSGEAWIGGNAWVFGNAKIYGNAKVLGDVRVFGNARVYGNAWVGGNAVVYDNALISDSVSVSGNAIICGNTSVRGKAKISGNAFIDLDMKHCGFDNLGSVGGHIHAYLTSDGNIEVTNGCFRGSIDEFSKMIEGVMYEREYKAIIELINIKLTQYIK